MNNKSIIFDPINIGKLKVNGRVFKSASAETLAKDGFVTDELIAFYEPMAKSGLPLIITGNLYINKEGNSTPGQCGADNKDKIPGLKRFADSVHQYGTKIIGQINHCGRQVIPKKMGLKHAVSASDITEPFLGVKPKPLNIDGIKKTIEAFINAAQYCQEAGFDGIEIHATHGYLINQFLSPHTNRRNDNYGGTFKKRMNFLLEIYHGIRARTGDNFTIIVKMSGSDYLPSHIRGLNTKDLIEISRVLQEEGVDAIEVSVGHYESGGCWYRGKFAPFYKDWIKEGMVQEFSLIRKISMKTFRIPLTIISNFLWYHYEGFNTKYSKKFKNKLSLPIISVGGFQTKEKIEDAINKGLCDAVSMSRAIIADPYIYKHFQNEVQGPKCNFCSICLSRVGYFPLDCFDKEIKKEKDEMMEKMEIL